MMKKVAVHVTYQPTAKHVVQHKDVVLVDAGDDYDTYQIACPDRRGMAAVVTVTYADGSGRLLTSGDFVALPKGVAADMPSVFVWFADGDVAARLMDSGSDIAWLASGTISPGLI